MDILNASTENERQIIQRRKPWGSSKGIQVTSSSMPANPAFRMEGSKLPVNLPKLIQQTPRLVVKKPWLVATKKEGQNNRRHLLRPENDPIFRTTIWTLMVWKKHGNIWKYLFFRKGYMAIRTCIRHGTSMHTSQESNKSISYLCSDYLYHVLP